ncbi:MAG: hypothetical protein EOO76_08045 [Novosphingobium sp.]|nr:MAG: hypothetical protein EOO76_08045 [Novosphingobium sp.]
MPQDESIAARTLERPIGIEARHLAPASSGWLRTSLTVVLIGGPLMAALLGWLGGGDEKIFAARGQQVSLAVETPDILRSGNWFETRVVVEPRADINDLAIAIDQPLWRGMSIDTTVPDAEKVDTLDDRFTYSFGPIKAGERFVLKIDGQIQPRGLRRLEGKVAVLDGERRLIEVPVAVTVLP